MSANAPAKPPIGITWRPPRSVHYKGNVFYGSADVQLVAETVPKDNGQDGHWQNVTMMTIGAQPVIIGRVDSGQALPLYRELEANQIALVHHLEWQVGVGQPWPDMRYRRSKFPTAQTWLCRQELIHMN